jgi:prepilin-type processing-associated H-X9-DG protein
MYQPRKLSGCKMSSEFVYMMDTSEQSTFGGFDFGRDVVGTKYYVAATRDRKRTNNLYADGHVANVDIRRMLDADLILYYSYWRTWPEPLWR